MYFLEIIFMLCAPGSLVLLSHAHALNFCSLFPTLLCETLAKPQTGRFRQVNPVDRYMDEFMTSGTSKNKPSWICTLQWALDLIHLGSCWTGLYWIWTIC